MKDKEHKESNGQHSGSTGMRGVARPMAEKEIREHNKKMHRQGQDEQQQEVKRDKG